MGLDNSLKQKIIEIRDYLYGGGFPDPLSNSEQLSYFFFLSMIEGVDKKLCLRDKNYKSIFSGKTKANNSKNSDNNEFIQNEKFKWSIWSNSLSGKNLLNFINDEVFPFYSNIEIIGKTKLMDDARLSINEPVVLKQVVSLINSINLDNYDTDTKGDIFEYILSQIKQAGELGQFRTPRNIIDFLINIAKPKLGEKIYDPAIGTGGFVISSFNYIKLINSSKNSISTEKIDNRKINRGIGDKLNRKEFEILLTDTFFGHDVDPKMVKLAKMNLILRGMEKVNIVKENTITENMTQEYMKSINFPYKFDLVLANPPFSGTIYKARIEEEVKVGTTSSTQVLFIKRILLSLNTNGRCCVIVPEGVLYSTSKSYRILREEIFKNYKIEAVFSFPNRVFNPYSGVKTSAIYISKEKPEDDILFIRINNDGYRLDKNHSEPIDDNDLPEAEDLFFKKKDLLDQWKKANLSNWNKNWCFANKQEIVQQDFNLSISRYYPFTPKYNNEVNTKKILKNIKDNSSLFEKELNNYDHEI